MPTTWFEDPPGSGLMYPVSDDGAASGSGDWRLIVERLAGAVLGDFAATSVVGACKVGSPSTSPVGNAKVGKLDWQDVTLLVRGMEYSSGADEPRGRPAVPETSVTLKGGSDVDPLRRPGRCRRGTLMRCALVSATDTRADGWLPQWAGLVEQWRYRRVAAVSESYVAEEFAEVTVAGTLSSIATLDVNSLGYLIGGGETVVARVDRLLTAADWQYGLTTRFAAGEPAYTLRSTDMAQPRITELYRTVDSTDCIFRNARGGKALVEDRERKATLLADFSADGGGLSLLKIAGGADHEESGVWSIAPDDATIDVNNDAEAVVNVFRWGRVGGQQQLIQSSVSRGRFGDRASDRTDLLNNSDVDVAIIADAELQRRARTDLTVDTVTVTTHHLRPLAMLAVAAVDIGDTFEVHPDPRLAVSVTGRVRRITHMITPQTDNSVMWTASFDLDVINASGIPGAILDVTSTVGPVTGAPRPGTDLENRAAVMPRAGELDWLTTWYDVAGNVSVEAGTQDGRAVFRVRDPGGSGVRLETSDGRTRWLPESGGPSELFVGDLTNTGDVGIWVKDSDGNALVFVGTSSGEATIFTDTGSFTELRGRLVRPLIATAWQMNTNVPVDTGGRPTTTSATYQELWRTLLSVTTGDVESFIDVYPGVGNTCAVRIVATGFFGGAASPIVLEEQTGITTTTLISGPWTAPNTVMDPSATPISELVDFRIEAKLTAGAGPIAVAPRIPLVNYPT